MTDVTKLIEIDISREDQTVSKEGFGIVLGLAPHVSWTDLIRSYSNLTEVGQDFLTDSKVYLWAEKVFSQNPRVPELKVGRRQVDSVDIEVVTAIDDTNYYCTINGTQFLVDSGGPGATPVSIAGKLVTDINLGSEPVTAIDNVDGTYTLDADIAGTPFTVLVDTNQTIQPFTPATDIVSDVQAIQLVDNDWYVINEFEYNEQVALAAYIETQEKLYGVFTDDANVIDQNKATDTTSIAALLHAADYDRSFVIYTGKSDPIVLTDPNSKYIEGAWCGKQLPTDPGSSSWANKALKGIPVDNLSGNQYDNALEKGANVYTIFAGLPLTQYGTVSSIEYIDIMRGIDWFTARLRERWINLLAQSEKIPYTDHGILLVENIVRAQIQDGIEENLIDGDRNTYYVTTPKAIDADPDDRIARILRNVEWQWRAAGAIQKLFTNGRITF